MSRWGEVGRARAGIIAPSDQWMRGRAWLKVDAAAAQLPVAEACRLRAVAPTDLARFGFGRRRRHGLIRDGRFSRSILLGLIFGTRHHRRKFARKQGEASKSIRSGLTAGSEPPSHTVMTTVAPPQS